MDKKSFQFREREFAPRRPDGMNRKEIILGICSIIDGKENPESILIKVKDIWSNKPNLLSSVVSHLLLRMEREGLVKRIARGKINITQKFLDSYIKGPRQFLILPKTQLSLSNPGNEKVQKFKEAVEALNWLYTYTTELEEENERFAEVAEKAKELRKKTKTKQEVNLHKEEKTTES